MKLTFTKEEIEGFKETRDCSKIQCAEFACESCPVARVLDGLSPKEQDEWIDEHWEEYKY